MSNAPDYETPTDKMSDEEIIENLPKLLNEWIVSADTHELKEIHNYLRGEKFD